MKDRGKLVPSLSQIAADTWRAQNHYHPREIMMSMVAVLLPDLMGGFQDCPLG